MKSWLITTLHSLTAADARTLFDFRAVHFAVVEVYLRCASPPFVLHVRRCIDAGGV